MREVRLGLAFAVVVALGGACSSGRTRPPPGGGGPAGASGGGGSGASDAGSDADASDRCAEPSFVDGFVPLRTFYVSPTGNDANDGSESGPWRTLKNVDRLLPGDLVEMAPGTYPGGAIVRARGTAGNPIVLRARSGPGTAVVEAFGFEFGITLRGARYVALDGLTVRGAQNDNLVVEPDELGEAADHVLVRRVSSVESQGTCLRARYVVELDVRESLFESPETFLARAEGRAALLVGVRSGRVLQNTFRTVPTGAALEIRGGSFGVLVDGNVVVDAPEGMRLGGRSAPQEFTDATSDAEATALTAVNNRFFGQVGAPFTLAGCRNCLVAFNTYAARAGSFAVRTELGGAGAQSGAATSTSRGVRITSNLFAYQGPAPASLLALSAADGATSSIGPNLYFATGGSVAGAASTPAIDLGTSLVDADPLFVDVASRDVHLDPQSPARGKGEVLPEVRRNGDGVCRTVYNLGAF